MSKSIQGSVGRAGRNFPADDVLTIQYLLNCVPANRGGPQVELVMDGAIGPKTIGAIERFQTRNLGFADGRVDPGGKTLGALQQFDPAPKQPIGPAAGGGGHKTGAGGHKSGHKTGAGGYKTGSKSDSWVPYSKGAPAGGKTGGIAGGKFA